MLIIFTPLVVLAAAVAWAAGLRRAAMVCGGIVVGLLLLGTVLGAVLDPDAHNRDAAGGDGGEVVVQAVDLEPTESEPRVRASDVVLTLPADPFVTPVVRSALQGLRDGDVRMVALAFEGLVTLHQCEAGAVTANRCAAGVVGVAVDDRSPGALVELRTQLSTPAGTIDCTATACALAAFEGPELRLAVPLAFDGPARPEFDVAVAPATGVRAGQDVTVTVDGLAPGTGGRVAFCTAAEGATTANCRDEAAVALSSAGPSGEAATTLRLAGCPRTDRCAVRVAIDGAPLVYAEVAFASPPGPDLGGGQLAGGLAAAGALLVAALVLLRRTDWTNPDGDPFTGIDVGHDDPFAGIDLAVDEWGQPWS